MSPVLEVTDLRKAYAGVHALDGVSFAVEAGSITGLIGPNGEQVGIVRVEDALRLTGAAEVPAHQVGLAILGPLRELDEVAYLRFASVYQAFDSLEDFESAITLLRAERDVTIKSVNAKKGDSLQVDAVIMEFA
mgnify:CR=1 FL=1